MRTQEEIISEMVDSGLFSDDEIRAAAGGSTKSSSSQEDSGPGPIARTVSAVARPVLQVGGAVGGAALAGGATAPTVAGVIPGAMAGGALGYAGGESAANALDRALGIKAPISSIPEALSETAGNIQAGAENEVMGPVIGKAIKGGAAVVKSGGKLLGKVGSVISNLGSKGVLDSAGVSSTTIERLAGASNPAEVGESVGRQLVKEGAIGKNPKSTFTKFNAVKNKWGEAVGAALKKIKDTNKGLGVYPELEDPLKVEANGILKPLLDKANEAKSSGYTMDRVVSRNYRNMYNSLADTAEKGKGFLTLDDVRNEMQKIGKILKKTSPSNDNHLVAREMYHTLADLRDSMVEAIADVAGSPALAENLKRANKGYSLYARIMPDIASAAAKSATSPPAIFNPSLRSAAKTLENPISRGLVNIGGIPGNMAKTKVGQLLQETSKNGISPAMQRVLAAAGMTEFNR